MEQAEAAKSSCMKQPLERQQTITNKVGQSGENEQNKHISLYYTKILTHAPTGTPATGLAKESQLSI